MARKDSKPQPRKRRRQTLEPYCKAERRKNKSRAGPVVLEKEGETVTGKRVANLFIKQYADVSDIEIDKDRRRQVSLDIQELIELSHGQKDIEMDRQFTDEELEQAIKALKMKKSTRS